MHPCKLSPVQKTHTTILTIHLKTEKAPVMCRGDSRRGLEPFAGFAQEVAERPDRRDGDGAGAASQNQDVVTPPAHIHQRVVLLLIWDRYRVT